MTPQTVRMLTRYNAGKQGHLDAVAGLPAGEATKTQTLFKNMNNTLNHLYTVDVIWRAHLEAATMGLRH